MVHEYLAHRPGRDREKVRTIGRVHTAAGQLQVRLVDKAGGVKRSRGVLASERTARQSPELVVDERKQPVERLAIAAAEREKEARDVAWNRRRGVHQESVIVL
jgi:hypothetical protein